MTFDPAEHTRLLAALEEAKTFEINLRKKLSGMRSMLLGIALSAVVFATSGTYIGDHPIRPSIVLGGFWAISVYLAAHAFAQGRAMDSDRKILGSRTILKKDLVLVALFAAVWGALAINVIDFSVTMFASLALFVGLRSLIDVDPTQSSTHRRFHVSAGAAYAAFAALFLILKPEPDTFLEVLAPLLTGAPLVIAGYFAAIRG